MSPSLCILENKKSLKIDAHKYLLKYILSNDNYEFTGYLYNKSLLSILIR